MSTALAHANGNGSNGNGSSSNGSKPQASSAWLQQTVRQFFNQFNWEDHTPEIQELRRTTATASSSEPLSLTLTVKQFFGSINWDGDAIASMSDPEPTYIEDLSLDFADEPPATPDSDGFTLDDFSGLF
jgi:hypothetical protein